MRFLVRPVHRLAVFFPLVINSRLIFSAGYYSAPIFFYFVEKKFFALPHFAAYIIYNILRDIILTSLD